MQLKRKKSAPSNWSVKEGELPQNWVGRREPQLRNLQDNVVFRLTQFERHRQRRLRWAGILTPILIIMGLLIFGVGFSLSLLALILIISLMTIPRALVGPATGRAGQVLGLERRYLEDLWQAGTPPREVAAGVWGETLRRGWFRWRLGVKLFWLTALLIVQWWPFPAHWNVGVEMRLPLLIPIALLAGALMFQMFAPWDTLPVLKARTDAARDQVELMENLAQALKRLLVKVVIRLLIVGIVAAIAVGILILVLNLFLDGLGVAIREPYLGITAIAAVMMGAAGGALYGLFVRRRRTWYLDRMEQNVRAVLEFYGRRAADPERRGRD